jgi:hypothetical protein
MKHTALTFLLSPISVYRSSRARQRHNMGKNALESLHGTVSKRDDEISWCSSVCCAWLVKIFVVISFDELSEKRLGACETLMLRKDA